MFVTRYMYVPFHANTNGLELICMFHIVYDIMSVVSTDTNMSTPQAGVEINI